MRKLDAFIFFSDFTGKKPIINITVGISRITPTIGRVTAWICPYKECVSIRFGSFQTAVKMESEAVQCFVYLV